MDLFYETQGKGDPIVMVHSPGVDSREWKFVAPILAKSHKVITFDGRGTGRSPAPEKPLNLVEDIRMLFEHLDIERAILIGHSMGGQAVTDFALSYPLMVEKLVLIAPSLTGYSYSQDYHDYIAKINSAAPDINKMVELSLAGPNYTVIMASSYRNFLVEIHTQYMKKVFTEWKSFEVLWPQPPAIERLEEISAKVLFISGTVEWQDMIKVTEQYKRVPTIKFVEIADADHMLTMTHAEVLAKHIDQFLREYE